MAEIDQWILLRAEELVAKCRGWYDEFAFHKVYRAVYDFATTDLSAIYFDVVEGPAVHGRNSFARSRRSAQTALYRITYALVRLLAPLLAFTTEEVWAYFRKAGGQSGQRASGAVSGARGADAPGSRPSSARDLQIGTSLMPVREQVLKSLETGASGEVHRCAARSAGPPDGERRSVSVAGEVRRANFPGCSSFRRWRWNKAPARICPFRWSAPRAGNASAAGSTCPTSDRTPSSRLSARRAAEAVKEMAAG